MKYKLNGETYTINITATAYQNPIKSMTLTGYKSGKNFATKAAAYKNIKLSGNIKNARLKATAADGWKIAGISIEDLTAKTVKGVDFGSSASTGSFRWGKMLKSHKYVLNAFFYNESMHYYQSVNYNVN